MTTYNKLISNQIYIGGWRDGSSDKSTVSKNPFDDAEISTIKNASQADVDEAYASAQEAQKEWAALPPAKRTAVLTKAADFVAEHKDDIAQLISRESGSTVIKAGTEVGIAIRAIREAATFPSRIHGSIHPSNTPGKTNFVFREPLGVVGVISPWNFPFALSMRSVAPALACGNAVVLKPASDTPVVGGTLLATIFEAAGLPAGVLNVVVGSGSEIGGYFVESPVPSLISFTGSTPVGKNVGATAVGGKWIKKVALELGGNAPFVVLDDAQLDEAVAAASMGKFLHQGQICMSINRIIVDASLYDAFVEKYVDRVSKLRAGDQTNPDNCVGPIINDQQCESVKSKIEQARADGAREVVSGEIKGRVIPPHVFADVTPEMELFREEIFGPVVGIVKARDEAHALELANDTEFGLSSAVFTSDLARGVQFARGIKAGMTHINDITVNDEAHVMFGGEKNSGLGRFNGEWAIEEFTTDHWVGVQAHPHTHFPI
ncbi:Putative aldehyde dehydrogenase YfmT [Corynebacterium cystitidis DSM 20524]|uniref:Aldehyde dehydrogenase (NAD+) n=1 Tax=Corynebacterium cystitidis DSM 20524 TaxID=1121357 RepID=A0A1H9SPR5_9CORY|nr:Putative aldehyde dehydrogenase YfmT [Corynebacterium cystitidis DSM 20524]SER86765.1 aldehyde dehydrogenase (NAD+) [Corynebacterium cystitidis DSM 20524]SNV66505.1 aldehyde dehydrogenase [Corynebacterium cystitidis]